MSDSADAVSLENFKNSFIYNKKQKDLEELEKNITETNYGENCTDYEGLDKDYIYFLYPLLNIREESENYRKYNVHITSLFALKIHKSSIKYNESERTALI